MRMYAYVKVVTQARPSSRYRVRSMTTIAAATGIDRSTAALAAFAAGARAEGLGEEVLHAATRRVIDTLGCGYGGWDGPPARIARELAAEQAGGAHVLGTTRTTSAELAAFANAVMVRYLDFNDVNKGLRGGGHPSDTIPAVLAVADAHHLGGRTALLGVVVAYQGFGAIPVHIKKRGWDQGILVATGVAMGVGAMLGLDAERIANAISLALVPNVPLCVTRRGELSMWKACASAATDRAAIFATRLAARGMTGPARAIEGEHGLWEQATGPFEVAVDPAAHGYRVTQSDIKRFPSCGSTQAPLSAVIELAAGLRPEDIEAIDVRTHWDTWWETGREPEKWDPRSRETADHSLPFVLALGLRDGDVTPRSFTPDAIVDQTLRPLMARITVSEDPALTALRPAQTISDIEIRTRAGERRRARTGIPKGDHRDPLSDAELEQKFRGMAEAVMPKARCDAVLAELWGLDRTPDASDVMKAWAQAAS